MGYFGITRYIGDVQGLAGFSIEHVYFPGYCGSWTVGLNLLLGTWAQQEALVACKNLLETPLNKEAFQETVVARPEGMGLLMGIWSQQEALVAGSEGLEILLGIWVQ
ncbi:hypothetical protein AMECASPLE_015973 [Ameca splendens]|uniref:Uncharacterized protein n=1 Tax=Ameca splendens TaxID=208324 RepID=A0ABV0XQW4_9TELE